MMFIGIGNIINKRPTSGLDLCTQYETVYNAMSTKPSDADALIQNTLLNMNLK